MKSVNNFSNLFCVLLILLLFIAVDTFAFDYNISFTAKGASSTIDYITVQNLTQGTIVTVLDGSNLEVTSVNQVNDPNETLYIYPNPIQSKSTVTYYSNTGEKVSIKVFGVDGRTLVNMNMNLSVGFNNFELTLPKGAYFLQINGNKKRYVAKVISQSDNVAGLKLLGNANISNVALRAKAVNVPTQYNIGDILLFKAYAGNCVSILGDVFSGNKTINFNFVECRDIDGNYYPIVSIGNQVWMAENLKTSKYRNSIAIADKTNLTSWGTSTSEASSDYATPSNSTTFGKLYNWYAVTNANNLAPLGWHISTDADWTSLSNLLGGLNFAGDKLKENGNSHWTTANTNAINSTGFTAIPGGTRSTDNTIYDIGSLGYWWTSTEGTTNSNGWYRSLSNQNSTVTRGYYSKSGGMSVRCLMGDLPILTTTSATSITASRFESGGEISFDGNYPVTTNGVCWSTNQNPNINDSKTSDWNGTGSFSSTISGLAAQTTYYVRAYASNSYGTGYGAQLTVSTALPTLNTSAVSSITTTNAICGGTVSIVTGAAPVTVRGICWSTNQNPTISNSKTTDGSGIGTYTSVISGLNAEKIYYVRAYATNGAGTAYGTQVGFSTKLPVLITSALSAITAISATCGGNITDIGGSAVIAKGVCWNTSPTPTIALNTKTSNGTGSGTFTSSITGLTVGTTYYVRAYAISSIGTTYGNEISFTTVLPTVATNDNSNITATTASCGGNVTFIGGSAVTDRGVCWSTATNPTITNSKTSDGVGAGIFTSSITGLANGTTYFVRAYATNSIGTSYGNEVSFSTLPAVATTAISAITTTTATSGGIVTSTGGAAVIARGVCWSTTPSPTIANAKTMDGTVTGAFTSAITGLLSGTTYYVRSYTTSAGGTAYGTEVNFTTLCAATTANVSAITTTTANCGGEATSTGGSAVITRGVCWSIAANPTISNSKTSDGVGTGIFISSITGLVNGTTYYVRAYATNSVGTSYGNEKSFSTLPAVTTTAISAITTTTATSGGIVTSIGGATVIARGVCWSTISNPTVADANTTDGAGTGAFSSAITGLTSGTTYYLRSYVTSGSGIYYGNIVSFTTLPTVTTTAISAITSTTATCGGTVTTMGSEAVIARGVCWSTTLDPTIANSKSVDGTGKGSFTSLITGLTAGLSYYVRAYATNSNGTSYGNVIQITTSVTFFNPSLTYGTLTDIDGNTYKTITIGSQTWMAENLKTTKFRNGENIPNVTDNNVWTDASVGAALCNYNNNATTSAKYGKLYNGLAVIDSRNIAPEGWHVPTNAEWSLLVNYANANFGSSISVAKALGATTDWTTYTDAGAIGNNISVNNFSGFSALPGGFRRGYIGIYVSGDFNDLSKSGYWWSATEPNLNGRPSLYYWRLDYNNSVVSSSNWNYKSYGYSIRCIKDF